MTLLVSRTAVWAWPRVATCDFMFMLHYLRWVWVECPASMHLQTSVSAPARPARDTGKAWRRKPLRGSSSAALEHRDTFFNRRVGHEQPAQAVWGTARDAKSSEAIRPRRRAGRRPAAP